jgi:hypothetical protein
MGPADVRGINAELRGCLLWCCLIATVIVAVLCVGAFFIGRLSATE